MGMDGQEPDSSCSLSGDELQELGFTLPNPLDRLAANVIDGFIVLTPFLVVLMAPFKRMLKEAVLLGSSSNFLLASGLCALTILLFSFIYKVYLTWYYGGTLGQLFMSLRVVNIWEPRERKLGNHMLRSIYWIFSYILLGLPFLSIISNEKRRCFHDRVSDTIVLSLKGRAYAVPSFIEKSFARITLVGVLFCGFLVFIPQIYLIYGYFRSQENLAEFLEEDDSLCSSVDEALPEWPKEKGPSRLSVAMALYATEEIEDSCLKSEVDFAYRSGVESGLTDLASAFIYADEKELSDQYLAIVCKSYPDSESCQMSRVIELWSEGEWDEINTLFDGMDSSSSIYVTIWGIRHFYRNHQHVKAMELLKSIDHVRRLTDFLGSQTVKLYWTHLKTYEARISAETALVAMSEMGRVNLNNWLCFEERDKSCERRDSCDYMRNHWAQHPESLGHHHFALAFLKDSVCEGKDYEYVRDHVPEGLVSDLAVVLGGRDKKRGLRDYLEQDSLSSLLRAEALRQLISIEPIKNLGVRVEDWLSAKKSWEWEKTGRVLFERLSQLKLWGRAYEVGSVLLDRQPEDTHLQEGLVAAAYHAKKIHQAQSLLSDYYRKKKSIREPASKSFFPQVVRQLENLENE